MPSTQLPEEINTALFDTNGRVQSLVGLVMDEVARTKVGEFASAVARLGVTKRPEAQAERELLAAVELLEEAQRLLAKRIRSIYEGP